VEVTAEVAVEVFIELAAAEVLIIRLDRGVGNLVYCYMVVQAGLGFDINTGAAEATTEVLVEVLIEVTVVLLIAVCY
jgi:hypothetical protein